MMKKSVLIAALGLFSLNTMAQDAPKEEGFVFTTVKENPITSIKNQNRSSTCWSFSSLGFLESELLRMGKGEYDLSEMFVVHHTMVDRGQNYVRYHGDSSFSPGGSFYDIMFCLKNYGLVPQEAMPGIMYGDSLPVHNELDRGRRIRRCHRQRQTHQADSRMEKRSERHLRHLPRQMP